MQFNSELTRVLDKHAPLNTRAITLYPSNPWFTDEVRSQKRKMKNHERCWRKYHHLMQWKEFKAECNRYKRMLIKARTESLSEKIDECNKDTKNLHSLKNNLTGSNTENQMLDAESDEALMNKFADYFMEKISKIRDEL